MVLQLQLDKVASFLRGKQIGINEKIFEDVEGLTPPTKPEPIGYEEGESASIYPWGGFSHDDGDVEPGPGTPYSYPIYRNGEM